MRKYSKVPRHLLVKWGRWFLQIVDIHVGNFNMMLTGRWFPQIVDYKGQWESISNIYITKIVVFVSEPVRGRSRATELPCYWYLWVTLLLLLPYAQLINLFVVTITSDMEQTTGGYPSDSCRGPHALTHQLMIKYTCILAWKSKNLCISSGHTMIHVF